MFSSILCFLNRIYQSRLGHNLSQNATNIYTFTCLARLSTSIPHTSTCLQCQKNNSILWEKDLKNVLTSCKLSRMWSHTIALCKKDDFLRRFVRVFCCQLRTAWMVLSRVFLFYLHEVFLLLLNSKATWVRVSFSY